MVQLQNESLNTIPRFVLLEMILDINTTNSWKLRGCHSSELLTDPPRHFLNRFRISYERGCYFQSNWWDVTNCGLDIVGNPLNKVRRVLVLKMEHVLVHLFMLILPRNMSKVA